MIKTVMTLIGQWDDNSPDMEKGMQCSIYKEA
jgi:hypothetical protein